MEEKQKNPEKKPPRNNIGEMIILGAIIIAIALITSTTNFQTTASYLIGASNDTVVNVNITGPVEENGGLPANIQDQTTRPFDIRVNQILDTSFALAVAPVINSYNLTLIDATNLSIGDNIAFLEQNGMPQLLFGNILDININTITLDTPVPYSFIPANTTIFTYLNNVNVDGSTTTQIFTITNFFDEAIDVVRVIWHCEDDAVMDDGNFCAEDGLERGIVFRKKKLDGIYINYWNIKNNGEWAELAFDSEYTDRGKPPSSTYTFASRLTYGGQSKHGVVIRLEPSESIELLIQDDLTGITSGHLMVEGHFIQN